MDYRSEMNPAATPPQTEGARTRPVILFDLDGTLIDSLELLVSSMLHAFEGRPGAAPSVEEWVAGIGRTLAWQFSQFAPEAEVPALIQRYRAFQSLHLDRLTRVYDGVPELLARLDALGHPLGVVTSKADHLAIRSLEVVGLASYIDVVIGADSTTRHKPEPEPILRALERLGALPAESVYVGDSPYDILAGNAAGVTTIGVTWGASAHAPLLAAAPTYMAATVAELTDTLSQLRATLTP
jgi:pyrophosphatase PpaX